MKAGALLFGVHCFFYTKLLQISGTQTDVFDGWMDGQTESSRHESEIVYHLLSTYFVLSI